MVKVKKPVNFIRQIIQNDLNKGKHNEVVTRFPPEPNGYLHIGHAKSICLNFSIAEDFDGQCNLRFDDTNPEKEDAEFVQAIQADVEWLGFQWSGCVRHSSDYFQALHDYAVELIKQGLAYVDSQDAEAMRNTRGSLTEAGTNSPFRERSIDVNLSLFAGMKNGDYADGEHILRAKIDMTSPNVNMRDPALYRIRTVKHQRTGNDWCIYPMYDYTHCISDAIEGITHSLCTLEFQDHRPLYDWVLGNISIEAHPQQIEFSRLNLDYTVMSKRLLTQLVNEGLVNGWNDPRMPTISGLRRRGFSANSIRDFADRVGVTKKENIIELSYLESCLREELDPSTPRVMGVLEPLKLVITNYPDEQTEMLPARNHPKDESMGSRNIPFSKTLYIEANDFMQEPPDKFFRLGPGREVRLRYAYYVTCTDVLTDDAGNVTEIHCTYDPDTKGGKSADGRKVRGTIHWVSAEHALNAEVRLYDRLFTVANPLADKDQNFRDHINPESLKILNNCKLEPSLGVAQKEDRFQFERLGYFNVDSLDHQDTAPIFNRIVSLRDSWAKR